MAKSQFVININTLLLLLILTVILYLYFYNFQNKTNYLYKKRMIKPNNIIINPPKNLNNVVSLRRVVDPLEPPERSYPHIRHPSQQHHIDRVGIPINIPTRGRSGPYQQVGTLTRKTEGQDPLLLPLYGKPTYPGSNQWLYYTSSDSYNSIKLPLLNQNKNCTKHYGCKEIYDGDEINVPSYDGTFKASIYELDAPRYIPYVF